VLADSAAELAAVYYNQRWVISIPASNFLYWVGPAHASAGHLDLPSTVSPTVAAEIEGHFDLATGSEVKGVFVLVDVGLPMALGCCFLAGIDFPANDLFLTLHIRTLPGPGNGLCALATTLG